MARSDKKISREIVESGARPCAETGVAASSTGECENGTRKGGGKRDNSGRILDLYEKQQHFVAYEIHDGFIQKAMAALLHLEACQELLGRDPEKAKETLDAAARSLRQSIEEARNLMHGMRPPLLETAGLIRSIEQLAVETHLLDGPKVEFSHDIQCERLAPPLENAIFRVVQETLTNARRHSKSDTAQVRLLQRGRTIRVEVTDQGVGFDTSKVPKNCFGLEGIRQRAWLFGGRATIESNPGGGTQVIVELPLLESAESGGFGK
jgi:signal transduction histidine kinase